MEVNKVTEEAYNQALATLGLLKKAEEPKTETKNEEELKKAQEAEDLKNQYTEAIKKAEELKAKIEGKEIVKAETQAAVEPKINDELIKGLNSKIDALGVFLQKGMQEEEAQKSKYEELKKAVDSISEVTEVLRNKIGMIEKTPLDRKSVSTSKFVEKEFAKGGDGSESAPNMRKLSLGNRAERKEIADILFKEATKNGKPDNEFSKAVHAVELGSLGFTNNEAAKLQNFFQKTHNITVVK